jgi:hypothetical protein
VVPGFLLVREASHQFQVPMWRLYYWIKRGRLPAKVLSPGRTAVRPADVQAVLDAMNAPPPAPHPEDFVPPSVAARQIGRRTGVVSNWAHAGKVASMPGPYGRLVRLADVQDMAAQARKRPTPLAH